MNESVAERLRIIIEAVEEIKGDIGYDRWRNRAKGFLNTALGKNAATDFSSLWADFWSDRLGLQVGHLEGLLAKQQSKAELVQTEQSSKKTIQRSQEEDIRSSHYGSKVFVVHGHDAETKESVARFVQKIGLVPIILHEQASSGRTILEKFEVFSDVGFAVVLLTPDDVGASAANHANLKSRARQNVILELGYFMGKLSRRRVCALYKQGVEIPSDYQGVVYVELDEKGAWRTKLAQELVQAGMSIDLEGLIES